MRRIILLSLLIPAALAAEARACSCVGESPQQRMASADAAFIGTVTAVRSEEADGSNPTFVKRVRVYTVAVEKAYKGAVGATAEVRGEDSTQGPVTSCGEHYEVGDTLGGFFKGPPSEWFIFTCNRATREQLEAGAGGFPAPSGSGDAVALLTGPIGSTSPFAALGADGRVIAYARGSATANAVWVSACPGGRRVVESTYGAVRTRRLADLAVVRTAKRRLGDVRCLDRHASVLVGDLDSRLVRIAGDRVRTLTGAMRWVVPGPRASLATDRRGRLLRVDSRTGRARRLPVPGEVADMSVSPAGDRLAVIARRRLFTFAASGRGLGTRRTAGPRDGIVWRGRRALAVPNSRAGAGVVAGGLWWARGGTLFAAPSARGAATALAEAPAVTFARVVPLPRPVRVSDPERFDPSASAGSPPRARRARAAGAGPRGDCPTA